MDDETLLKSLGVLKTCILMACTEYGIEDRTPKELVQKDVLLQADEAFFRHLLFMEEECQRFFAEGSREKLMRWLGFIEGALAMLGILTIEELKSINSGQKIES